MQLSWYEIFLLGVGLAMDALAVTISTNSARKINAINTVLWMSAVFGLFQSVMPILGWILGGQLANIIGAIDHWVAAIILFLVGVNMMFHKKDEDLRHSESISCLLLLSLGVVTSLDALAVGVSLSLTGVGVVMPALWIGIITLVICFVGGLLGRLIRIAASKFAGKIGGSILIGLGAKILIEHLRG